MLSGRVVTSTKTKVVCPPCHRGGTHGAGIDVSDLSTTHTLVGRACARARSRLPQASEGHCERHRALAESLKKSGKTSSLLPDREFIFGDGFFPPSTFDMQQRTIQLISYWTPFQVCYRAGTR